MSTAKCEEKISHPQGPRGIRCYIATTSKGLVSSQISGSGSWYEFQIENHRTKAVAVKIKCKSDKGYVEFDNDGNYENTWEHSLFLEARSPGSPAKDSVKVNIQPAVQTSRPDEINTMVNVEEIVLTTNPSISADIEVDVN